MLGAVDLRGIEVIAHRGASKEAPENTMSSFRRAAELGADWIELDIRKTKDGKAVVIHDGKLDRTTNGKGPVRDVNESELLKLDAGSWFGKQFEGECIPTLEKVFHWASLNMIKLHVEIKDYDLEKVLVAAVWDFDMIEKIVVSSRSFRVLKNFRSLEPRVKVAPIIITFPKINFLQHEFAPEYLHLWSGITLTKKIVDAAHSSNMLINAWMVDSFNLLLRTARRGVTGVFTNEVSSIRRTIEQAMPNNWI